MRGITVFGLHAVAAAAIAGFAAPLAASMQTGSGASGQTVATPAGTSDGTPAALPPAGGADLGSWSKVEGLDVNAKAAEQGRASSDMTLKGSKIGENAPGKPKPPTVTLKRGKNAEGTGSTVRRPKRPSAITQCLPPGSSKPQKC